MQFERIQGEPGVFMLSGEKVRFEFHGDTGMPPVRAIAWKEDIGCEGRISESSIADIRGTWTSREEAEIAIMNEAKNALAARD